MKQKRIISLLIILVMILTVLPGNIVFAATASNSTYGIKVETGNYIICGKCNTGKDESHKIKSMSISPSGQQSNGKVTFNITVNMDYSKNGHPTSVTIPYTVDVSCDNTINLSKQGISNSDGYKLYNCTITKNKLTHTWSNGTCTRCKKTCSHTSYADGKCTNCQLPHSGHTWSSSTGKCTVCGLACGHTWSSSTGKCTVCGHVCGHTWSSSTGKCTNCGLGCSHSWSNGKCTICTISHSDHNWTINGCSVCGLTCNHTYDKDICTTCGYSNASYIDCMWNADTEKLDVSTKNINELVHVVSSGSTWWSSGWYVVKDDVTVTSRITVGGTVHLLLCDGATLNAKAGIELTPGNTLYIYSQSTDVSTMGELICNASAYCAGIGGSCDGSSGKLTVNGGNITAIGGNGVYASGIGGGMNGSNGTVTINGGIVYAKGGSRSAGIGSSNNGRNGGNITINNGTVNPVKGYDAYAELGSGYYSKFDTGSVIIRGGNVNYSTAWNIKNGDGNDVSKKTYVLNGVTEQKKITSLEGVNYGVNFYTLDTNKIYVSIQADENVTSVKTTDGQIFKPKNAGDTALYCTHERKIGDYCDYCSAYLKESEPQKDSNGAYQISTLGELVWFAEYTNDGNSGINAVLTNDIDASKATNCKIGSSDKPYSGIFDGGGHKITVSLSGSEYTALFPYINGATIKNLSVDGTVKASGKCASGLVGCVSGGDAKIENCLSFVKIDSSVNGDGTHGGLVANAGGGSISINNCAFLGAITGENTTNCGGLVGWAAVNVSISNSYVAAEFSINASNDSSNTIARNPNKVKISNCYYLNQLGYNGTSAEYIEEDEIKSGKLAYKLNGSMGGGDKWYQNIDSGSKDEYPVPSSTHGKVYYGYKDCKAETIDFTNTYTKKSVKGHNGGEADCLNPGYCVDCGAKYIQIDSTKHCTTETYYKRIDDNKHGQYHSCCNALIKEEAHKSTANGATCTDVAKCDICNTSYGGKDTTVHTGERKWVDTGYGQHEYKYTCCGLVTETEDHSIVYEVNDDTDTIEVKCEKCADGTDKWNSGNGTVTLEVADKEYDGKAVEAGYKATGFMNSWYRPVKISFEYCCEGGCKTARKHTVTMHVGDKTVKKEFMIEKRTLTVTKVRAFGKAYDMTNEVFVNAIDLHGIVVYKEADNSSPLEIKDNVEVDLSKAVVTVADSVPGSYSVAKIENIVLTGADKDNYTIAGSANDVEIEDGANDYYTISKIQLLITPSDQTLYGADAKLDQTAYTVEGLDDIYTLSGEFLYEKDGKIKVDSTKVKITYNDNDTEKNVTEYFDISEDYTGNVVRYCANHYFDDNGFCATGECDSYEAAVLITKENCAEYGFEEDDISEWDTKYAISNAGQLYWFADRVNNYYENSISGILAEDITVNEELTAEKLREWTPIGGESSYTAAFDGRGHTVSGLYFNDAAANYVGLFGKTDYNNDIKNINISNSYFEGNENIGAIIGYAGSMISNCTVSGTVTVTGNGYYGGIAGNSSGGGLKNSLSMATVPQSDKFVGGLVGNNRLAIKNCYTTSSNIVGHNDSSYYGSIANSYYLAETDNGEGGKTAEQFANGEVAYKLQEGVEEIPAQGYWDDDWENWTEEVPAYIPQIWGQKIGTDKFPKFSDTKVYEDEYENIKAYRNEISGFEILLLGADKKSATVVLDEAGKYTIVFADYDGGKLANVKSFDVEVTGPQAIRIISDEDFTLGTGDKVMLWDGNMSPKCKAFEVK